MLFLNAPYFYFGLKLRNVGIKDLNYSRKVTLGLLTYLTLSTIVNLLSGWTGLIWAVIIYFYYKAYKETKIVIEGNLDTKSGNTDESEDHGEKIEDLVKSSDHSQYSTKEGGSELKRLYETTGRTSVLFAFLGILLPFIGGWIQSSYLDINTEDLIFISIISIPFLIPFYYFGNKIKNEGIKDLEKTSKISLGMLIYVSIFAFFSMAAGGGGVLWFIVIYYYYKTYRGTRKYLSDK